MASGISSSSLFANLSRNLNTAISDRAKAFERLSSGLRLNRASDGPAELAVAAGLEGSIRNLGQAGRNVADFTSALEIADGAIGQIQNLTSELSALATQASTGTVQDRTAITAAFGQFTEEIQGIINTTEFNGTKLLQGTELSAQIGTNGSSQLSISTGDLSSIAATLSSQDLSTAQGAQAALDVIRQASDTISSRRGELGAFQARLGSIESSISSRRLNEIEARSRIIDDDVADSVVRSTLANIRANAGTALFAQASKLDVERVKKLLA